MGNYYTPKYMEKNKWNETVSIIRQRSLLTMEYNSIIAGEAVSQDGIRGGGISDPTSARAIKAQKFKEKIDAIEGALELVPEEYQKGVLDNIIKRRPFPGDAARATYAIWKRRYIIAVASRLNIV